MNHWATWLAACPPTVQRAIARFGRISLPRHGAPATRLARLRAALCHARTVRVTYFALPAPVQAAAQLLRGQTRGLSLAELTAQHGPLRAPAALRADRTPQSISEHLLLLGWLLPRPATPRHPTRYLLPPEVRAWLPHPLTLPAAAPAPVAPPAPVLRVAATLLLRAAEAPLPLAHDGTLRAAALRELVARLAPLPDAAPCCQWTVRLLGDLGLLAPHGAAAVISPAGQRFLALPAATQRAHLQDAWLRAPHMDAWLRPLLTTTHGLDHPTFRRRLCAWVAALPTDRLLAAPTLNTALSAALGPLADATTHPYRRVDRVPWQPARAAAIWDAALRGPLTWLGLVGWADATHCYATAHAHADMLTTPATDPLRDAPATGHAPPPWSYAANHTIVIPHAANPADVLRLLPYARWQQADARTSTYQLTPRTLAQAVARGHSPDVLWALLARQAGTAPDGWCAALTPPPARLRLIHAAVLLSDDPAVLQRATQPRTVQRHLAAQLAPGIALVDRTHADGLLRALTQQDLAVTVSGDPTSAAPAALSPAECVALLTVCASYRQHAAPDAPPLALAALEARLRAALPPALRAALPEDAMPASSPPLPPHQDNPQSPITHYQFPPTLYAALCAFGVLLWTLLLTRLRRLPPRPTTNQSPITTDQSPLATDQSPITTDQSPIATSATLHHAIARRQTVQITYTDTDGRTSTRSIRPLRLETHAPHCYLHAYCCARQAERCFRVDRITQIVVLHARPPRGHGCGRPGRPPSATAPRPTTAAHPSRPPRGGFITPPPATGNPLVRVWLEE